MTYLVLVRHGETVWHAENRYAGISDIALTTRGLEQAAQLAAWARTARLSAVWASTLSRAQLTAAACAEVAGTPLRVDERLRELDFGAGEGLTSAQMRDRFPDAPDAVRADPVASHMPDGEDPVKAADRFTACLYDIADQHPDASHRPGERGIDERARFVEWLKHVQMPAAFEVGLAVQPETWRKIILVGIA